MHVVRCSGCATQIGVSDAPSPLRNKVWCTPFCRSQPPVGQHETRDAVIAHLSGIVGRTDGAIATLFGIGRSRVQQIASMRRS